MMHIGYNFILVPPSYVLHKFYHWRYNFVFWDLQPATVYIIKDTYADSVVGL